MANNPSEGVSDDFLDQILGIHPFSGAESGSSTTIDGGALAGSVSPMMLQLSSGHSDGGSEFYSTFPLGLSLEQGRTGFLKQEEASGSGNRFREEVFGGRGSSLKNTFHGQPMHNTIVTAPHTPIIRPRVRARRGQATDPHSIAERLRREKIAERIRGLQELVPSVNKTDRAAMLDEIVDYVKFLRLQVKVLSMSRLGGAGAVAPLVTDIPISCVEEEGDGEGGRRQEAWEKLSNDGTEQQVVKLMEENIGAAMQFLQSKALCIMPISLASAMYPPDPTSTSTMLLQNPQTNPPPP